MALYKKDDEVQLVRMSKADRVHAKDTASVHLNGLHVMIESIHTEFSSNGVEEFYVVRPLKEPSLDDWRKYGFAAQISPADKISSSWYASRRYKQFAAMPLLLNSLAWPRKALEWVKQFASIPLLLNALEW